MDILVGQCNGSPSCATATLMLGISIVILTSHQLVERFICRRMWLLLAFLAMMAVPALLNAQTEVENTESDQSLIPIEIYRAADSLPADIEGFVYVTHGHKSLNRIVDSHFADGARSLYRQSDSGTLWHELSTIIGADERTLFRDLFGSRVVFAVDRWVSRGTDSQRSGASRLDQLQSPSLEQATDASPWIALISLSPGRFRKFSETTTLEFTRWMSVAGGTDIPVYRPAGRPAIELTYSKAQNLLYLTTNRNQAFFDLVAGRQFKKSLADVPEFHDALHIGVGDVVIFDRSKQPAKPSDLEVGKRTAEMPSSIRPASWTSTTINLTDDGSAIQRLEHDATRLGNKTFSFIEKIRVPLDISPLESVNNGALCAWVETFTAEPRSNLGTMPLIAQFLKKKPEVLTVAGPSSFTAIFSRRPRTQMVQLTSIRDDRLQLDRALNQRLLEMSVVWGVELKKPVSNSRRYMDDFFLATLKALQLCIDNPNDLKIPVARTARPGMIQTVDLTACSKSLIDEIPGMSELMLHWVVVEQANRSWWVCATHIDTLQEVADNLQHGVRESARENELVVGALAGPATATLLESWPEVNATTNNRIFGRLFFMQEVLKSTPRVHWTVSRVPNDDRKTSTSIEFDWGF